MDDAVIRCLKRIKGQARRGLEEIACVKKTEELTPEMQESLRQKRHLFATQLTIADLALRGEWSAKEAFELMADITAPLSVN